MAREIPNGWKKVDKYAMTYADMSICRVYVGGEMIWELWKAKALVFRGKDADGAYDEAVMLSKELSEVAA